MYVFLYNTIEWPYRPKHKVKLEEQGREDIDTECLNSPQFAESYSYAQYANE